MEIKSSELKKYQTMNEQFLVKIRRDDTKEDSSVFTMKSSTSKEVTKGVIVCADKDHQDYVGKECIIPVENTIPLDTYTNIDDGNEFEYRIIQHKNVFLVEMGEVI